jgi:hypothetical protein
MNHLNPKKAGLAVGAFVGGVHVVWSLLVALNWAQLLINFVLWMHMISLPYVVKAFDFTAALTLIVITYLAGYAVGYLFAKIWNRLHRA